MNGAAALETNSLSVHVRLDSREVVLDALVHLGVGRGAPVPVWPPKRLPHGLLVSPVRNGWVSIWSPLENTRDWFPSLTETLECPGVVLQVVQSKFWLVEFLRDGDLVGRYELPTEAVLWDDLWARAVESLEQEGVADPWDDELRLGARMDEIAATEEYREVRRQLVEERPDAEALAAFLPAHASVEYAQDLVLAIDRRDAGDDEEGSPYAEDYLDAFASYLGIRDAAWDPRQDAEALSEGDYEDEEGLPEGWRDFVVLPLTALPVLTVE